MPELERPTRVRDNLRSKVHLETKISLNKESCFLREANLDWLVYYGLHVVFMYIDDVKVLPAIANDERKFSLVETWHFFQPVFVSIRVILIF